jgi:exodeoxyribonuclease VII small subunit
MGPSPKKSRTDQSPKSFEHLMEELEGIVGKLESGELTLERSIELFEAGMKLAAEGMGKLDAAEKKVELLLTQDGQEKRVPFTPEDDEGDSPQSSDPAD